MAAEIHVNDIGTAFRATILDESSDPVNLAGATDKALIFCKPDKTVVTKSASFYTDGTDGVIQYISESGFLDQPSKWQLQGYVVMSGSYWRTNIIDFLVYKNLE